MEESNETQKHPSASASSNNIRSKPIITIQAVQRQFSVAMDSVQSLSHPKTKSLASPEVIRFATDCKSPESIQKDYYEKFKNFKLSSSYDNSNSSSSSSSSSKSPTKPAVAASSNNLLSASNVSGAESRKKRHSMIFTASSHNNNLTAPLNGGSGGNIMEAYPFTTKFFVPNTKITLSFKEPISGLNGFHVINFVFAAIETIKKYGGLTSEGIFRKNGSKKTIESVIDLMEKGKFDFRDLYELIFNKKDEETVVSLAQGIKSNKFEEIVLICADVMKRYFKSIPEPLIPSEIGKELLTFADEAGKFVINDDAIVMGKGSSSNKKSTQSQAQQMPGFNQIISKIRLHLKFFPKINLIVFHALLVFFSEITNPENAILNKMPR